MCNPYQDQIRFRIMDIQKIPNDAYGVYGIWYGRHCLYVGQAKTQPIWKRLEQHWKSTHSHKLKAWIAAKGPDLRVAFLVIPDRDRIDYLERYYIRRFQPLTNEVRYEGTS